MGKWHWKGVDKSGNQASGELDVGNKKEARMILRKQGIKIRKLSAPSLLEFDIGEWLVEKGLARSFSHQELCLFTKQLSIMINAGIPITQAFEILHKSTKSRALKQVVRKVAKEIEGGGTIAGALKKQKKFSNLYCNLVQAGESAGTLDVILNQLSDFLEKQEKLRRQVKSALNYPIFASILGSVITIGMLIFLVPRFTEMLEKQEKEIPFITQMVLNISTILQEWALIVLPVVIILALLTINYAKSDAGRPLYDRITMRLPILGNIIIKGNLGTFTMTLAITLSSGVPLIEALDICIDTLSNSVIKKDLKKARMVVTSGKTLTSQITKIPYFPEIIAQMIKVGEQTGHLDTMLKTVSDVLVDEVNILLTDMAKMIEPLAIVLIGGVIACILVAIYLPMLSSAGGGV